MHFGNSSLTPWSSPSSPELTINNWVGNATDPSLGGGPDQIFFGTNGFSELSGAKFNSIQFPNEPLGAVLLSDGELVPNVSGNPLTVPVLGDWNGDGVTWVADISAALAALSNLNGYEASKLLSDGDIVALGDFNGDGVVSNADVQGLINFMANQSGGVPAPRCSRTNLGRALDRRRLTLAFIGRSKLKTSIVRREISLKSWSSESLTIVSISPLSLTGHLPPRPGRLSAIAFEPARPCPIELAPGVESWPVLEATQKAVPPRPIHQAKVAPASVVGLGPAPVVSEHLFDAQRAVDGWAMASVADGGLASHRVPRHWAIKCSYCS